MVAGKRCPRAVKFARSAIINGRNDLRYAGRFPVSLEGSETVSTPAVMWR